MTTSVQPGSVLVGVDGSTGADLAAGWAAGYAETTGRALVLVHGAGAAVVTDFAIDLPATEDGLLAAGRDVTERALALIRVRHPGLEVRVQVMLGDPRTTLAALGRDASLLVVGSRGRGALAGLLLGSVSVALAAHAPCPVVVVRSRAEKVAGGDLSVVVGVDGPQDGTAALTFAFERASSQYRPLEVVHALGSRSLWPASDVVGPEVAQRVHGAEERLVADMMTGYGEKFPDVVVRHRMARTSPTQALVEASLAASLVVVGCRGQGTARSRLLGSVSRSVLEQAHCSVAVVRGGS